MDDVTPPGSEKILFLLGQKSSSFLKLNNIEIIVILFGSISQRVTMLS